jgi:hypothetical protein
MSLLIQFFQHNVALYVVVYYIISAVTVSHVYLEVLKLHAKGAKIYHENQIEKQCTKI